MTAEPFWPGIGPSMYQSTTCVLVGTWICPFAWRPSRPTYEVMPIAGIVSLTGRECGMTGKAATFTAVVSTGALAITTTVGSFVGSKATKETTPTARASAAVLHQNHRRRA